MARPVLIRDSRDCFIFVDEPVRGPDSGARWSKMHLDLSPTFIPEFAA